MNGFGDDCDDCGEFRPFTKDVDFAVLILVDCRYNHIESHCSCGTVTRIYFLSPEEMISAVNLAGLSLKIAANVPPDVLAGFGRLQRDPTEQELHRLAFDLYLAEHGEEAG